MATEAALRYRQMEPGDETEVCDLVRQFFDAFVAPEYSDDGIREFLRYGEPDALARRCREAHFVLVAQVQDQIVGMIETRQRKHVSLLFADEHFQLLGIARGLLRRAVDMCLHGVPDLSKISVNSSPNAVPAYKKLGVVPSGPERAELGSRFVPMVLAFSDRAASVCCQS